MKYLVTNFAYGTGPYLRTTEFALAVNRECERLGMERYGIIVPLVYGDKQKRIMKEEFGAEISAHPDEILLDAELGAMLGSVYYGDNSYEEALRKWVATVGSVSEQAERHLRGNLDIERLSDGVRTTVPGSDIVLELARAPRVRYGVAPVYAATFGYISEVLEHVLEEPETAISLDRALAAEAIPMMRQLEEQAVLIGHAEPGTFSYLENRAPRYASEVPIPPTISTPRPNTDAIEEGIYVTITGIPGLERLYAEAEKLGLKLYSNDTKSVPGSHKLLPHVVPNPAIRFQFARSGWGSVWLSMLSGTPIVCPDFDPKDDPEIFFNNRCIEKLGIGIIYRGQPLSAIVEEAERLKPGIAAFVRSLQDRFGILDGSAYTATLIAKQLAQ